jgi:lysophospholipase L1-like esterase
MTDQLPLEIPAQPDPFPHRLPNLARQLQLAGAVKIVAIGSSSTAGRGPGTPYPCWLELALREKFSKPMIDVLNRGAIGDEAPGELLRLKQDVIDEKPALVIWQVGTNAAWKGYPLSDVAARIDEGLRQLSALPIDVVLMDLQYAPAVITAARAKAALTMVDLIADSAARANVNVFRRFALMKQWHEVERISFDQLIDPTDPDRLHQSDYCARRFSFALRDLIMKAL